MNYSYGNKAQWRRWAWNRVSERAKHTYGFVIGLAAENAMDIPVAKRKGFSEKNFIAIERDETSLLKLRNSGRLSIHGDLWDVLGSWPKDRKVSVVMADLCGGLSGRNLNGLLIAVCNPALFESVFVLNLLRGRDNSQLVKFASGGVDFLVDGDHPMDAQAVQSLGFQDKHRGRAAAILVAAASSLPTSEEMRPDEEMSRAAISGALQRMNSAIYSYRSTAGNQWFDCVVFVNPFSYLAQIAQAFPAIGKEAELLPQRRRTAAVLAHHTRRAMNPG